MARSKWKAPYIKSSLIYKINRMRSHTTFVYIKERSSVILPHFVGHYHHFTINYMWP
jgi:ribosomal protein S19